MASKKSQTVEALKAIPIFASCSKRELQAIASSGTEVWFDAGDEIYKEGRPGMGLHVVLEGETKVQVHGRTRRKLGPGAFFGEIALLDGGPRTATVIAATPVHAWTVPRWGFKSLLLKHPSLTLKILEEVCSRLRSVDSAVTD